MNMKKEEIIIWFKAVYDKLFLVVVLAALLLSLLWLIFSANREKKSLADDQWEQRPAAVKSKQRRVKTTAAQDAVEIINYPYQIGAWNSRLVVAELRVNCVKCGRPIPVIAEVCPFRNCAAQQPKIVSSKDKDSDFDGIPDEWEKRYDLGVNIDDASQDADSDGFANLEEYRSGTNPRDAASAPPLISKLRVMKIRKIPLPLFFGGAQKMPKETLFLLKNTRTKRDSYCRIGETNDGYKVIAYQEKSRKVSHTTFETTEDSSVLKVSKEGKTYDLVVGDKTGAGELAAQLIYMIDNSRKTVKKGDVVPLKNNKYKIIDITSEGVIVADMQTGAETTLEPYEE